MAILHAEHEAKLLKGYSKCENVKCGDRKIHFQISNRSKGKDKVMRLQRSAAAPCLQ